MTLFFVFDKIYTEGFIKKLKPYIWATLWSLTASLIFTTAWYVLFSYNMSIPLWETLRKIFGGANFWLGVGIWTVLYSICIGYPIVFLGKKESV